MAPAAKHAAPSTPTVHRIGTIWKVVLVPDSAMPEMQTVYLFSDYSLALSSFQISYCQKGGVQSHNTLTGVEVFNCDILVGTISPLRTEIDVLTQATHF